LGCLRAGLVFVPLDARAPDAEARRVLSDLGAALLISDDTAEARVHAGVAVHGVASVLGRAVHAAPAHDIASVADEDVAMILYTSGSTGSPKGVAWSHGFMIDNAQAQQSQWQLTADDTMLHVVPMAHSHGYSVALNSVLLGGARLRFLAGFSTDEVVDELASATVFSGVPTMYVRLLESTRFTAATCANVRLFLSSSAALSPQHHDGWEARAKRRLVQCYGLTETGTLASTSVAGPRKRGAKAWPGVELRVVDDAGKVEEHGRCGHLQVRKHHFFAGYWRRPADSAACFTSDGFYRTGDLAVIDAEGLVSIVGRANDIVISGGYNIHPREVELACERVSGVKESAVVGAPHPSLGEVPVAYIVPQVGFRLDVSNVLDALRRELAPYKVPRWISVVDELPRLAVGKVDARRLREDCARRFVQRCEEDSQPECE
jgi:malonyl-CoA/methylmalonyl-CoA synthetase